MCSAPINPQLPNSPLTPEHRHELTLAKGRVKSIRNAANVAGFNGWATAIIAALSVPFALVSIAGFLITVVLAVVAYNEFRGRKRLLDLDPSSATLLGCNQIGLLASIAAYCLWMLFTSYGSFAIELQAKPELQAVLGSSGEYEALYHSIVVGFYGTVLMLSVTFQGLTALYYFTRRKHVHAYLHETPRWVQDIERMTPAA
jgi:hypothetical protein